MLAGNARALIRRERGSGESCMGQSQSSCEPAAGTIAGIFRQSPLSGISVAIAAGG